MLTAQPQSMWRICSGSNFAEPPIVCPAGSGRLRFSLSCCRKRVLPRLGANCFGVSGCVSVGGALVGFGFTMPAVFTAFRSVTRQLLGPRSFTFASTVSTGAPSGAMRSWEGTVWQ
jgi:hypothetical protein